MTRPSLRCPKGSCIGKRGEGRWWVRSPANSRTIFFRGTKGLSKDWDQLSATVPLGSAAPGPLRPKVGPDHFRSRTHLIWPSHPRRQLITPQAKTSTTRGTAEATVLRVGSSRAATTRGNGGRVGGHGRSPPHRERTWTQQLVQRLDWDDHPDCVSLETPPSTRTNQAPRTPLEHTFHNNKSLIGTQSDSFLPLRTKGFANSAAALATYIRRRYKLDRVLLLEHGFHFGQLPGLEVVKLGNFVPKIDRVSGREGQK